VTRNQVNDWGEEEAMQTIEKQEDIKPALAREVSHGEYDAMGREARCADAILQDALRAP
jgi:hypothetical protein